MKTYRVTKTETIDYTVELTEAELAEWLNAQPAEMAESFTTTTDVEDTLNSYHWSGRNSFEEFIEGKGGDVQGGTFRVETVA